MRALPLTQSPSTAQQPEQFAGVHFSVGHAESATLISSNGRNQTRRITRTLLPERRRWRSETSRSYSLPSMRSLRWLSVVVFGVVSASGCRCGNSSVSSRYGDLVVVQTSATGRETLLKEATVTLPPTFMDAVGTSEVPVRNVGLEEVAIASVTRLEGSEALSLDGAVGLEVNADADAALPVRFAPPQDTNPTLTGVIHRAKFSLQLRGARPGDEELIVELVAEAVARDCFVPALVDFGAVPLRQAVATTFRLENGGAIATSTTVGAVTGADASAFDLTAPGGVVDVPAMNGVSVRVRFSPLEERAYSATVAMRRSPACPEGQLELRGTGNDAALSWSPARLDFGRIPLGVAVKRTVTVSNGANVPLSVNALGADANFSLTVAPALVPAKGTATFEVQCSPTALGPLTGQLQLDIGTDPPTPARIPMTCTGGGPRIRIDPNPLQIGTVPLNEITRRRLIVQNVGTAPPMPNDASLNLTLGTNGSLPWFAIVPRNATTTASEFGIALSGTYDNAVGVPALAGRNFVEFEITLRPVGSTMPREADLLVYSNDAVTPVARVPISAVPRARESCVISLTPGNFDFGRTSRGVTMTRTVSVENTSPDPANVCLISGIELAPGSDLSFRVTQPSTGSLTIPGGSNRTIEVTGTVANDAALGDYLRGTVRFHAAGEMDDRALPVSLLVSKCLVPDPVNVDVGLVQVGCVSAGKPVTLYNVCGTPVTVSSFDALPPPFNLAQGPTLPTTVNPGSSITVTVNAAPGAAGSFAGVMQIQTGEGPISVALQGTSDAVGSQSDTFMQANGLTDILLVIDNSCSMGDEQAALASNFAAFISSATMSTGDWHIGVVTTDTGERGQLRRAPGEPTVLIPSTPSVANVFANRVSVGINGSGFEQPFECMQLALSEPQRSGANAGFLRTDAFLAVVVVTDAMEQSPSSVGSYLATLRSVKGGRGDRSSLSVVGPFSPQSSTCSTEGLDDGRYHSAITQSAGVESDICTQNWAMDLQAISRSVFASRRAFELTGTARGMGDIVVTVDGQVVTNWTYDPANNAIVFNPAPLTGSTIGVTYRTACF